MKKCSYCGAENSSERNLCLKCGQPLMYEAADRTESEIDLFQLPEDSDHPEHKDSICPHCGGNHCDPISRTATKVRSKGYSISNGFCGMCLLGPFGLLCGLCGKSTKVNMKNEVVWICKSCGKEHLSQKDALEKAKVMMMSYMMSILLIAAVLSTWHTVGNLHWFFLVVWAASPILCVSIMDNEISEELGYPFADIIPPSFPIVKSMLLMILATILVLIFGGQIVYRVLALL